jgi:hypothetical protein
MKVRAIARFTVSHGSLRLIVRVLPTILDVDTEYREGRRRRDGNTTHAYFQQAGARAHHFGTIVLPANGDLNELVPHEVAHASVRYRGGSVHAGADERHAIDVGLLTARIHKRCARLGIGG